MAIFKLVDNDQIYGYRDMTEQEAQDAKPVWIRVKENPKHTMKGATALSDHDYLVGTMLACVRGQCLDRKAS